MNERGEIIDCPDPKAGLYIKSRTGKLVHAKLPENSLAFQVGETMQIHTGGWLQATPHGENMMERISSNIIICLLCSSLIILLKIVKAVRGCNVGNVTRETFAVFMEPE